MPQRQSEIRWFAAAGIAHPIEGATLIVALLALPSVFADIKITPRSPPQNSRLSRNDVGSCVPGAPRSLRIRAHPPTQNRTSPYSSRLVRSRSSSARAIRQLPLRCFCAGACVSTHPSQPPGPARCVYDRPGSGRAVHNVNDIHIRVHLSLHGSSRPHIALWPHGSTRVDGRTRVMRCTP